MTRRAGPGPEIPPGQPSHNAQEALSDMTLSIDGIAAQAAQDAKDALTERGWATQDLMHPYTGGLCLMGAAAYKVATQLVPQPWSSPNPSHYLNPRHPEELPYGRIRAYINQGDAAIAAQCRLARYAAPIIREQFPDRLKEMSRAALRNDRCVVEVFNDHEKTTFSDVEAVLDKIIAG